MIFIYFNENPDYKVFREATIDWWEKREGDFFICTSAVSLYELRKGNYLHQEETIKFVQNVPFLPDNQRVREIAQYYIDHHLAPKEAISDFLGDALHLAFSAFYKVDYLLTWNQKHLANVNKLKQ
jgi:predicted nucleic acid-binding protein